MVSVDVVVPCFNYARFLRQAVESAIRQDGVEVRVFIIDDCSTDSTPDVGRELAQEYAGVTFRRHAVNRGHIATYNEGIAELAGDYFLLLSADDYLLAGALSRATRLMEANENVGFVFGRAIMIGDNGASWPMVPLARGMVRNGATVLSGRRFVKLASARNIVPTPTAVVRTKVQVAAGGYRPELPHTGDMEMWLRLSGRAAVGYVDADQAVYRLHGTNMSMAYEGIEDLEARRKALDAFFADGAYRIDPSGALRRKCLHNFSGEAFRHARMALNRDETLVAERFKDYGLAMSPTARLSLDWLKLMAKQTIRRQSPPSMR